MSTTVIVVIFLLLSLSAAVGFYMMKMKKEDGAIGNQSKDSKDDDVTKIKGEVSVIGFAYKTDAKEVQEMMENVNKVLSKTKDNFCENKDELKTIVERIFEKRENDKKLLEETEDIEEEEAEEYNPVKDKCLSLQSQGITKNPETNSGSWGGFGSETTQFNEWNDNKCWEILNPNRGVGEEFGSPM